MSVDLGLDDHVDAVTRSERAVEWVRNFLRLADEFSRRNIFGDAATRDVGNEAGQVPVLGQDGRLADSLTPQFPAGKIQGGEFGNDQIPDLPASRVTGVYAPGRFLLPVSKLQGEVPLVRIPASKRPSMRVGVTEVRGAVAYRIKRDAAKVAVWGRRPETTNISISMEGSVQIGTMEVTYYVNVSESYFRDLARGLGIASGQASYVFMVGNASVTVAIAGDVISFGAVVGDDLQQAVGAIVMRTVDAIDLGGSDGGGEQAGRAGMSGSGAFAGEDPDSPPGPI